MKIVYWRSLSEFWFLLNSRYYRGTLSYPKVMCLHLEKQPDFIGSVNKQEGRVILPNKVIMCRITTARFVDGCHVFGPDFIGSVKKLERSVILPNKVIMCWITTARFVDGCHVFGPAA